MPLFIKIVQTAITLVLLPVYCASSNAIARGPLQQTEPVFAAADCELLKSVAVVSKNNPVPCQRLRRVSFRYYGFDQKEHQGQLTVLDVLAPHVLKLMTQLHAQQFPIAKALPIEHYGGDDKASMADNNTSAFNGRAVSGGSDWSMHAYGVAIDLNPVQNPFIQISKNGTARVSPVASAHIALNRLRFRPNKQPMEGMAESVVETFAAHGFLIWGGDWNFPIDYQHFQIGPRGFVEAIVKRDEHEASIRIDKNIELYVSCRTRNSYASGSARKHCVEEVLADMKNFYRVN